MATPTPMRRLGPLLLCLSCVPVLNLGAELQRDAGVDGGSHAGSDAGFDAGPDAGLDAGPDAGNAGSKGPDGGPVTASDAGSDAGVTCSSGLLALRLGSGRELLAPDVAVEVTVSDFNRDGIADLTYVESGLVDVAVQLGRGDGTFSSITQYAVSGTLYGALTQLVTDVNGDGAADLITGNSDGTASVLLNRGDGTFGPQTAYGVGNTPRSLAAADFNRDGRLDLAVSNASDTSVSLLFGAGDGGFLPQQKLTMPLGDKPGPLGAADFDGDGKADLAVSISFIDHEVDLFPGDGDGGFGAPRPLAIAVTASALTVADLNGDSRPDLVLELGTHVDVLRNTGGGGFAAPVAYAGAKLGRVADLDADGVLDLITLDPPIARVWLGLGSGSFVSRTLIQLGEGTGLPAVGDLDGDGKVDLLVPRSSTGFISQSWYLDLVPGNGDGTFLSRSVVRVGASPAFVLSADLDQDGALDLVSVNTATNDTSVARGDGVGSFYGEHRFAVGPSPVAAVAGDFTGDHLPDLVVANRASNDLTVLQGNGNGMFTPLPLTVLAGLAPVGLAAADFNGDGALDVAVADFGDATPNSSSVAVLLGHADGTFSAGVLYDVGTGTGVSAVAVGDFNGDARLDLLVAERNTGAIVVLRGRGDGTFTTAPGTSAAGEFPVSLAVGDLNGDGRDDFVVVDEGQLGTSQQIDVKLATAAGLGWTSSSFAVRNAPRSVAIGDIDADGRSDVVVANRGSDNVSLLLRGDAGTFTAILDYPVGLGPSSVVISDFNGDGLLDVAVADDALSVLLNRGRPCLP